MDSIAEFAKSFPGKPKNRFSLKWNDFRENLSDGFSDLLEEKTMVDVTLAADGKYLQAHKLVLSVCSPYFKNLFKVNPCKHPIVILNDVGHNELSYMLQFMYRGEVGVKKDDLPSFLKLAHTLKVKGLTGNEIETDNLNLSSNLKSTEGKIRKKRKRDAKAELRKNSERSTKHRVSLDLETGNKMKDRKKQRKNSFSEDSTSSDSESESGEIYKGEPSEKITCDKSQCKEISRASESVSICERSFNEVESSKDLNCDFTIKNDCDASDDNIDDEGVENVGLGDADGFDLSTVHTDLHDPADTDQTPQGGVDYQMIQTKRGRDMLLYGGYTFTQNRMCKDGMRWQCSYPKCKAFCRMSNAGWLTPYKTSHDHPKLSPEEIRLKVLRMELKARARSSGASPGEIIRNALSAEEYQATDQRACYTRCIQRFRKSLQRKKSKLTEETRTQENSNKPDLVNPNDTGWKPPTNTAESSIKTDVKTWHNQPEPLHVTVLGEHIPVIPDKDSVQTKTGLYGM